MQEDFSAGVSLWRTIHSAISSDTFHQRKCFVCVIFVCNWRPHVAAFTWPCTYWLSMCNVLPPGECCVFYLRSSSTDDCIALDVATPNAIATTSSHRRHVELCFGNLWQAVRVSWFGSGLCISRQSTIHLRALCELWPRGHPSWITSRLLDFDHVR